MDYLRAGIAWVRGLLRSDLYYVTEPSGWVVDAEARNICRAVATCSPLRPTVVTHAGNLRRQIVHFGYLYLFVNGGYEAVHRSNRVVVTFYHGDRSDPGFTRTIEIFLREIHRIDKVIVSCSIMRNRLLEWGVPEEKIVQIPIGVDLSIFRPPRAGERGAMRARLGIPEDRFVIGSFQKDGVGWEEGLEPKLIKGPDVFLDVVERISRELSITVLLTGPARGFVKRGLAQLGVPYRHVHLNTPEEVAPYYHALDLYLITSREEGGPKAVLESMASEVPLVSTRVGMAADLIQNGENGFVCAIDGAAELECRIRQLLQDPALRQNICSQAVSTVRDFAYQNIGRQHYECVYRAMLKLSK